jgi:hypothetical protein
VEARSVLLCRLFVWWGDCVLVRGPVGDAASSGLVARSCARAWADARPGRRCDARPSCQPPAGARRRTPGRARPASRGCARGGRLRSYGPLYGRGVCPPEPSDRPHTAAGSGQSSGTGTRDRRLSRRLQGGLGGRWRWRLRALRRSWRERGTSCGDLSAGLCASRSLRSGSASLRGRPCGCASPAC